MSPRLHHRNPSRFDTLSKQDVLSLLAGAHALERAEQCGVANQPLRGKNLAVLGTPADESGLAAFRRAATRLGAQVTCIPSEGVGIGDTVVLLGRLYDAVNCEGLDDTLVERLRGEAGVPVYDGLTAPQHPIHALAVLMAIEQRSGKPLAGTRACVVHPRAGASAVASLLHVAALVGLELCVVASSASWPAVSETNGALAPLATPGSESAAHAMARADVVLDLGAEHTASADGPRRYTLQSLLLASLA